MQKAVIVILNYNGRSMLQKFLPVVLQYSKYEVVIIDNASDDDSAAYLETEFPQIKVIFLKANYGYSKGYNLGLHQLENRYEYYILINSDLEVTEGWDEKMVLLLDQNKHIGAAQPKILSLSDKNNFDYAGAAGGFLDRLGYPFCRGRVLHTIEKDHHQYDDLVKVDWASGACFFIRASLYHEHGGFDEVFFAHMEEIDLCWRLRSSGNAIYANGAVAVYHLGGGTLARSNPIKTYLNFRNSLFMLYKNHQQGEFYRILTFRLVLDFGALLHITFSQGISHGSAIFNAYKDFFKNKHLIRKTNNTSSLSALQGRNVFSIILEYYVRGKKIFSELSLIK